MDFDYSPRQREWMNRVGEFMQAHIYPAEEVYNAQMAEARAKGNPWIVVPVVEELKAKAKKQGLWKTCSPMRARTARSLTISGICAVGRIDGPALRFRRRSVQFVPPPTPAIWKCWSVTAARGSRTNG